VLCPNNLQFLTDVADSFHSQEGNLFGVTAFGQHRNEGSIWAGIKGTSKLQIT
jgi:hypothetical protein